MKSTSCQVRHISINTPKNLPLFSEMFSKPYGWPRTMKGIKPSRANRELAPQKTQSSSLNSDWWIISSFFHVLGSSICRIFTHFIFISSFSTFNNILGPLYTVPARAKTTFGKFTHSWQMYKFSLVFKSFAWLLLYNTSNKIDRY